MRAKHGQVGWVCRQLGISRHTYYARLSRGWSVEEARMIERLENNERKPAVSGVNAVLRGWKR